MSHLELMTSGGVESLPPHFTDELTEAHGLISQTLNQAYGPGSDEQQSSKFLTNDHCRGES